MAPIQNARRPYIVTPHTVAHAYVLGDVLSSPMRTFKQAPYLCRAMGTETPNPGLARADLR